MNQVGLVVVILSSLLLTENVATIANETNQQKKGSMSTGKSLTGQSASTVIREAIFGDPRQLLSYLSDEKWRRVVCTPALKDTYDLFQASLQQELNILWDLNLNISEQGLTERQHDDLKACIAEMEKYDDNFEAWEELSKAQRQK